MTSLLLYITVFISGGVLMGLEIVGSRVLAPYFGNSIFVWGSLISVVLAALSLGYYWGGRLSTRNPSFPGLLLLLLIPGTFISLLPFVYPPVNGWIVRLDFGNRLNPLVASMLLFLLPSVFLGAISPYAVRLSATALNTVGNTAGTLYALSTCGSIFGTLFTAFYLIPVLGVRGIVHALGVILLALCLVSWGLTFLQNPKKAAAFFWLTLVSGVISSTGLARAKTLYAKDSFYHHIHVEEDEEARYLYFDRTLQSAMNLDDPTSLRLVYPRFTSLGLTVKTDPKRVLMIGLGAGSIATKYHKEFPSMVLDVAEIDPEVVAVAKNYFHFQAGDRLHVHVQDGRLFITRTEHHYDIVLLDAYYADAIPFHLTTLEFFRTVHQKLTDDGVTVVNIIGAITGPKSKIVRSFVKTLRQIFPQIYLFPTLGSDDHTLRTSQNIIVLAGKNPQRVELREIVRRATALGRDLFPRPLSEIAASYLAQMPDNDDDVPILTDDYAPTDSLLRNY